MVKVDVTSVEKVLGSVTCVALGWSEMAIFGLPSPLSINTLIYCSFLTFINTLCKVVLEQTQTFGVRKFPSKACDLNHFLRA